MIGTISYDTESGLGILAKSFIDHGVVDRILVIPHPHYPRRTDWYTPEQRYDLSASNPRAFLSGLDTILLFENCWNCTALLRMARKQGIRIVLMPMYEYTPQIFPVEVDLYICPSLLDLRYYPGVNSVFLSVPVEVPWRERTQALHFVHNAGHGGKDFRNGTRELLEAIKLVKSPARFTIRCQPTKAIKDLVFSYVGKLDHNVELMAKDFSSEQLFATGDVFVFPEKFNGLSLPLQEAYASGMLVMAGNRFPMNTWLPVNPLIPVEHFEKKHLATTFDSAVITPQAIAKQIDLWYEINIESYSKRGREWAEANSWEKLKPRYMEVLLG